MPTQREGHNGLGSHDIKAPPPNSLILKQWDITDRPIPLASAAAATAASARVEELLAGLFRSLLRNRPWKDPAIHHPHQYQHRRGPRLRPVLHEELPTPLTGPSLFLSSFARAESFFFSRSIFFPLHSHPSSLLHTSILLTSLSSIYSVKSHPC